MKNPNTPERLYFRYDDGIEILGKSDKTDQDRVITRIRAGLANQEKS